MSNDVQLVAKECTIIVSTKGGSYGPEVVDALKRIKTMDGVHRVEGPVTQKGAIRVWSISLKLAFVANPRVRATLLRNLIVHFKGVPLLYCDDKGGEIAYDRWQWNIYPH